MGEIGRRLGHTGRAASPGATGVHPQGETALVSLTRQLEIKPRGCDSRLVVTAEQQAAPRRLASADQSSASRKQLDGKAPLERSHHWKAWHPKLDLQNATSAERLEALSSHRTIEKGSSMAYRHPT